MTTQEIFDTVVNHLLTQGRPALGEAGDCRYLTDSGLRCAVGCLIKPEHYDPAELEGESVVSADVTKALRSSLGIDIDPITLELLEELQAAHDSVHNRGDDRIFKMPMLTEDLRNIAIGFSLSPSAIDAHCKPS